MIGDPLMFKKHIDQRQRDRILFKAQDFLNS